MKLSRQDFHHYFYIFATGLLMFVVPLSHFAMGLITFLLTLNWLAEWNWKEKWSRLRQYPQALVFSGLYLVMCVGLIHADHLSNATEQLLANLSIFFAPIIIVTSRPFTPKNMRFFFNAFILGTAIAVVCSIGYWLTHEVRDMRSISLFIDHIRFSLCVLLSIVFSIHLMRDKSAKGDMLNILYAANVLLLLFYIFVAQTLTGVVILVVLMIISLLFLIIRRNVVNKKTMIITLLALLGVLAGYFTYITYGYFHDRDQIITDKTTALGNDYYFGDDGLVENGHRVNYYVCREEMAQAWKLRSDSLFDGMTEATLIRYLNSKGLHKDYAAVMSLSDKDVRNVEREIANVDYTKPFGLKRALYQTYFCISKYRLNHQDIQGSSLMQRVELWTASWNAVKENWLFGVGLGDQKAELDLQLEKMDSPIAHKHNRGCHNQFLTYWMMGGILLLCYFLFVLAYPFVRMRKRITFVYLALFIIVFCSMLVEDTIDSQSGKILYAIVMPMLLFNETTNNAAVRD